MPNPYAVLGLAIGEQDPATIRRAFLKAVRTYAPQSHPTEFVCIVEAYEMLRDPVRRTALEGSLVEVSPGAGKHRRLGGLTPQSAAAFLKARDGRRLTPTVPSMSPPPLPPPALPPLPLVRPGARAA